METDDSSHKSEVEQQSKKALVLIVDDDYLHHKLFSLIADRLDITAHLARSGLEAIEAVSEFAFDLILMDCRMPGIDGYECTELIRKMAEPIRSIPIVAVTACVLPGDRERCMQAGMDDFLGKPFTLEQLHQMIFQWLPSSKSMEPS